MHQENFCLSACAKVFNRLLLWGRFMSGLNIFKKGRTASNCMSQRKHTNGKGALAKDRLLTVWMLAEEVGIQAWNCLFYLDLGSVWLCFPTFNTVWQGSWTSSRKRTSLRFSRYCSFPVYKKQTLDFSFLQEVSLCGVPAIHPLDVGSPGRWKPASFASMCCS